MGSRPGLLDESGANLLFSADRTVGSEIDDDHRGRARRTGSGDRAGGGAGHPRHGVGRLHPDSSGQRRRRLRRLHDGVGRRRLGGGRGRPLRGRLGGAAITAEPVVDEVGLASAGEDVGGITFTVGGAHLHVETRWMPPSTTRARGGVSATRSSCSSTPAVSGPRRRRTTGGACGAAPTARSIRAPRRCR